MKVHAFALPALLLSAAALSFSTDTLAPRRYRIEIKTKAVQDLTVAGQGVQTREFTATSFVSVTLRDSTGGQVATIVLDSLLLSPDSPVPAESAKALVGTTWDGFVPKGGRMKELTVRGEVPLAQLAENGLQQLFPPLRDGPKAGQKWTDTTETTTQGIGVRTVTNYETSGAILDGARVIRLAGNSSASVAGEQAGPQGSFTVEGTAQGTSAYLISPDGIVRRGEFSSIQNLSILVSQLPEPIPVTVTVEGTSSLLP